MKNEIQQNKNIRQGDVFLLKIDALPDGTKTKDNVLAFGEITGHKHQVIGATVLTDGSTQYVEVETEAELVHEEHAKHQLKKGVYRVIIQRELDLVGEFRRVID